MADPIKDIVSPRAFFQSVLPYAISRLVTICSLAVCGLAACNAPTQDAPISFAVRRGDLVFARSFYGELVARKRIEIYTPALSGVYQLTVESVLADGTKVKRGDVVLTFATGIMEDELRDQQSQLGVAQAEMKRLIQSLARDKIDLTLAVKRAELGVDRAKLGVISGVNLISKVELDKAKIDLSQAQLALALARKALRIFAKNRAASLKVQRLKVAAVAEKAKEKQTQVAAAKLLSPASGVIYAPYTRLNWVRGKVGPGSVTRPGDKILEIPDLSSFDVALFVRQRDATLLKVGDTAIVYPTALGDQSIKAHVTKKENFATTRNERLGMRESSGNLKEVRVLLRLDKSFGALRPGGTVRANVNSQIAKNVLILPLCALEETNTGHRARLTTGQL
ncbi:MAG: efflux RND transporter periplasmic adaptor subunit, partial [Deltaproteobacteria bacterium]|nr:efflux RND transporter periplasmic adaptor subunit [Deltaproteobacteria bacterium]